MVQPRRDFHVIIKPIMAALTAKNSLHDFQELIKKVYAVSDDRLFSVSDLISNQERFTMRALKGIRKGDINKLTTNLVLSFSWLVAVANRLHLDLEDCVWKRFQWRRNWSKPIMIIAMSATNCRANAISHLSQNIGRDSDGQPLLSEKR